MSGALTQLAAYGAQDVYLTGNSPIPVWKENFVTNSLTLKHAAIFASAMTLAVLFFYMKRNRLSLLLIIAIGVIFTFIRWTQ